MLIYVLIFHLLMGIAHADSLRPADNSESLPIWPEGASVFFCEAISLNSATEVSNPTIKVYSPRINSSRTAIPPTLLVHAKDDTVDPVHYSLVYERELKKAGVQVKLNIYKNGGHAFGVSKSGKDTDRWTEDAIAWLKEINML